MIPNKNKAKVVASQYKQLSASNRVFIGYGQKFDKLPSLNLVLNCVDMPAPSESFSDSKSQSGDIIFKPFFSFS